MSHALPAALPLRLRTFLHLFRMSVAEELGPNLIGIYLLGSVLGRDFQSGSSDIDFLVVTRRPLTAREGVRIQAMHRRLARASRWGSRLDGGYAARGRLRPWGILGRVRTVEGGRVDLQAPNDWTSENLMAVREQGLALLGPHPVSIVPAVDTRALTRALDRYLRQLVRHRPRSPASAAAVTLNVARCLYSVHTGRPSWKTEAARWLEREVPTSRPLLAAALAVHRVEATARERRLVKARLPALQRSAPSLRRAITPPGTSARPG